MPHHVLFVDLDHMRTDHRLDSRSRTVQRSVFDLIISGSLVGVTVTLQSPVTGAPPVALVEGVDFLNGVTFERTMQSLLAAISRSAARELVRVREGSLAPVGLTFAATLESLQIGNFADRITITTAGVNAANLSVNGTAGPGGPFSAVGGTTIDAEEELEDILNNLAPAPAGVGLEQVRIVRLIPDGTRLLIHWFS